jgi:phosphonate transport system substrate-binding protein
MIRRYIMVHALFCFLLLSCVGTASAKGEILIGLIPEDNIFRQMDRHRPLADYLSAKLGTKVKFTILSRYGDVLDRFINRKMDGAFFGTLTGVLAMEKLDAEPIVRMVYLDGSSDMQGYIITRKDSGIQNAADMKGRRMAYVDRATVTGYLYAIAYLRDNGVRDPYHYFRDISFTGSHSSVVYSVLDGRADVGTVKSRIFQMLMNKDRTMTDELQIISRSPDFHDSTLLLSRDLPAELRKRIGIVLLEMEKNADGREALRKLEAQRFVPAAKEDFTPFYEIAGKARINMKTYRYK